MNTEREAGLLGRIPSTTLSANLGESSGTDNSPPITPDVWLAAITAAMQTYVDLGTTTGPVTAATISGLLRQTQTQQHISPPTAASVLNFLQTSQGAAVLAGSTLLATHAVAYITTHAPAPTTPARPWPLAAANEAVTSRAAAGEEATAPGAQAPPGTQLSGPQAVAVVESTNAILGNAGKPAFPSRMLSIQRGQSGSGPGRILASEVPSGTAPSGSGGTSSTPGGSAPGGSSGTSSAPGGSGSGSGTSDPSTQDDSIEEDWVGNCLVGIAGDVVFLGEELGEAITSGIVEDEALSVVGSIGSALANIVTSGGPPDSDGMGSGAGAPPFSIENPDPGDGGDTDGGGGGGPGSGIDDSSSHEQQ